MASHFTLRMQFGLHQDPKWVSERLLELARTAPVDEVMFFIFAEEQNDGHETLERIKLWMDHSRPYRKALADEGVAVSLNPWHSVLHADRGRRLKEGQNWQTLVDVNGRAAKAQVCPLDRDWQRYYEESLKLYAKEGFRVIWIDDDIRMHNHAPLEWGGCWCPLHLAEFSRRVGKKATREEIVANCTAPGEPHPWRGMWFDMMEEMYAGLITRWREIVEAGGACLGLMSSRPEAHGAEGRRWATWWKAFGGERPPIQRPHFWSYGEELGKSLINSIALLDEARATQPADIETGPEIDNGPYGPWTKSFRQTGAAIGLAHILGSTNLNISLYDFLGNDPHDEPERVTFLREWRPTADWLADEFPMTLEAVGVGVPWNEDMGRRIRTDRGGKWASLECPTRGWANWLGTAGHAFTMRPSPTVNAIGGPIAWSFSDDEIREWLTKGVLLDGVAADILIKRGFGELIGITGGRFVTIEDALYSIERCTDEEFALRPGAEIPLNAQHYAAALFQGELQPGVRVASELLSPTREVLGQGLVVYENRLGGRVATVPWIANGAPPPQTQASGGVPCAAADVLMTTQRAAQLGKVLGWLGKRTWHGSVEGGAYLVPQFLTNGKMCRGAVWNASADAVTQFTVKLPTGVGDVRTAVQVDAHGIRYEARIAGGRNLTVMLPRPMCQWEFVVLL